jgi:hypothetical protein
LQVEQVAQQVLVEQVVLEATAEIAVMVVVGNTAAAGVAEVLQDSLRLVVVIITHILPMAAVVEEALVPQLVAAVV